MPLLGRSADHPIVVDIRPGAIAGLPQLISDRRIAANGRVAVVVGAGMGESVAPVINDLLPGVPVLAVARSSITEARRIAAELAPAGIDTVVGIGGGGTLDTAKYAAGLTQVACVSVATTLTHDGLASPVAVLEQDGRTGSHGTRPPVAVVVDLEHVARGPERHLRSGIGEAVSNLSAVQDWTLSQQVTGETVDGLAMILARTAGESVLRNPHLTASAEFLTSLANGLVISGIAMTLAGTSRPCSGAEHEISHAINALYGGDHLHGETVAVGTLFASFLRADPALADYDAVFASRGLPRLPEDLGLTASQFAAAIELAPATRPDRYTILEHLALDRARIARLVESFREALA